MAMLIHMEYFIVGIAVYIASMYVLYFVIKGAVKNALLEDRLLEAKVAKKRSEEAADQ